MALALAAPGPRPLALALSHRASPRARAVARRSIVVSTTGSASRGRSSALVLEESYKDQRCAFVPLRHRGRATVTGTVEGVLAVLAPGQGAQKPGMLTDWLELPGAEPFFRWAGAIADADLLTLGTTGDAEAIKDTAVTQPLVVAMSLFIARELGGLPGPVAHTPHAGRDVVIAGHSVGELTAAALAGVLSIEAAIALTAVRGRAMAAACAQTPTGMSAVLGGDPDEVLAALDKHGLTPANINGGGQVVAAGPLDGLAALKADPPAKARVMPLSVAGAFHTAYMASAREELEGAGRRPAPGRPQPAAALQRRRRRGRHRRRGARPAGQPGHQPGALRRLPGHACASSASPPSIELPPAGALAGLAKREWKGAGHRDPGAHRPRRPRPRPRADRRRARPRRGRAPARLAGRRLPGPRHGQPGRDRRGHAACPPAPRSAASAAGARRSTSPPATTACWPSGSCTTATSSTPVTRSPVSTRRSRHDAQIQLPTGAPGARILGLGAYRPRRRVTNDDLAQVMDTNDEWIQSRVGIAERRWASEDETLVEMAVAAGGKALAASGLAPDEIDLVIVASASLRVPIPGIGPQVGAPAGHPPARAPSTSTPAAPGSATPSASPPTASAPATPRNALVVGVERLTDVTDHDRPLDGGDLRRRRRRRGASAPPTSPASGPVAWGSDGDQYNAIEIAAGSSTMTMAGQAVYRWATTKLTETLVAGDGAGRRRPRPTSTSSPRTRPTCASSSR